MLVYQRVSTITTQMDPMDPKVLKSHICHPVFWRRVMEHPIHRVIESYCVCEGTFGIYILYI